MDSKRKKTSHKNGIDRRQFLRIVAISGVAGLALKTGLTTQADMKTVSETQLLMGTLVNLTIVTSDTYSGRSSIRACLDHMSRLEAVLSRFQPQSQLSRLNRQGYLENADSALIEILEMSKKFSQLSDGAFDITILPILNLFTEIFAATTKPPSADQIARVQALVDYRNVIVAGKQVSFTQPGMGISLDGIAKGYIVDQGVDLLQKLGYNSVLVEAGGDLYASGRRNSGKDWNIGVQSPRNSSPDPMTRISIANQSAATSGDYIHTYSPDFNHHHIIDPRSGYSASELSSVTIVCPQTAAADALATAVMVLGLENGLRLAQSLPNCEALLVTKDLETYRSKNFPERRV